MYHQTRTTSNKGTKLFNPSLTYSSSRLILHIETWPSIKRNLVGVTTTKATLTLVQAVYLALTRSPTSSQYTRAKLIQRHSQDQAR